MLSVQTWMLLTQDCGWSQRQYVKSMKQLANKMLVTRSKID